MWWWFWGDCYTFCDTSRVVLRWTFHLLNKRQYINSQKKTKKLRSDEESCVFLRVNIDRHWNTDDIYIIILFLKKLYHFKLYNRSRKHLLSELNSETCINDPTIIQEGKVAKKWENMNNFQESRQTSKDLRKIYFILLYERIIQIKITCSFVIFT